MEETHFHLEYRLSRVQRLVPMLRLNGMPNSVLAVLLFIFFCTRCIMSIYPFDLRGIMVFAILACFLFVLYKGVILECIKALLHKTIHMDIDVDDLAFNILVGNQRYMLFLDGILEIKQYYKDVWTIRHYNSIVFQIPASAITAEQIAFLQAKMEYGKTPEGIQAAIDRGRMVEGYYTQRRTKDPSR